MSRLVFPLLVLLTLASLVGCGSAPATEGQPLAGASSKSSPILAVRLTVRTNWSEADRYFYIDRLSEAVTPYEEWQAPNPVQINEGFEFYVDLSAGARYIIALQQPMGADFVLPDPQEIDLRSPSASQLECTLEYGDLGESGQRKWPFGY